MAAVKIPASCLALVVLGEGTPFGTINLAPTYDEKTTGYVTPPQGHIIIREIPSIILNTAIAAKKIPKAVPTRPVGNRSVPRSNLENHLACRVLFGTSPAR
jgi:hypothetical protein